MATINLKRIDDDYQFVTTDETGQTITMDIPVDKSSVASSTFTVASTTPK